MRNVATAAILLGLTAQPCAAQDYFETLAVARHGNGFTPAAITAGWETETIFTVIAISRDGARRTAGQTSDDWRAVVTTGPRGAPDSHDEEEDDRYQDRDATAPASAARRAGPLIVRKDVAYSSLTCPALARRIEALKPLATFEFNPATLKGNEDGPNGNGREGLDLWIRAGGGELQRSAETENSVLGGWFKDTITALSACPGVAKAP